MKSYIKILLLSLVVLSLILLGSHIAWGATSTYVQNLFITGLPSQGTIGTNGSGLVIAGTGGGGTDWIGSGTTLTASSTYNLVQVFGIVSSTQLRSPSSSLSVLTIGSLNGILKGASGLVGTATLGTDYISTSTIWIGGIGSSTFNIGTNLVISSTGTIGFVNNSGFITTSTNNFGGLTNSSITATSPITWSGSNVIACATCLTAETGLGNVSVTAANTLAGYLPAWTTNASTTLFATSSLYWDSTNLRVGVGTASPGNPLHIVGSGQTTPTVVINATPGTNQNATALVLRNDWNGGATYLNFAGNTAGADTEARISADETGSGTGAYLAFWTDNTSNAIAERMRIDNAGNVGIGITVPSSTLHVSGTFQLSASSTVVTPAIGGAIVSGGCDSATSSVNTIYTSSTTAFITTPRNNPNQTLGGTWAYTILTSPGVITTYVCANITLTPNTTDYVVKIIR